MPPRGHHIRAWRKHRGLSQKKLAAHIGIKPATLSAIESGEKSYDQPFLEATAFALKCSVGELLMIEPRAPLLWGPGHDESIERLFMDAWKRLDPRAKVAFMEIALLLSPPPEEGPPEEPRPRGK